MRKRRNISLLLAGLFSMIGACRLVAQTEHGPAVTKIIIDNDEPSRDNDNPRPRYRARDRKEILLRMGEQIRSTDLDCSHFVQWLFEQAGLYYDYAPSQILYDGMAGFERVFHPERGDLIVWPGHVGIVVDPEEQTFLSALRSGVKTASYTSQYWKMRGIPHFFRYLPGAEPAETDWQPAVAARRTHGAESGSD
jgi:hypothetical protein